MKYLVKSNQIRLRNAALNCIGKTNEVRLMPTLFVACQVMKLGSDMPHVTSHIAHLKPKITVIRFLFEHILDKGDATC